MIQQMGLMMEDDRIRSQDDGSFLVASKSNKGTWHVVNADGECDCMGYLSRQTCWHVKLLATVGKIVEPFNKPAASPLVNVKNGITISTPDRSDAWLWTARYQNPNIVKYGMAAVRTTLGAPKMKLAYPIVKNFQEVAPQRWYFNASGAEFDRHYRNQLERYGFECIVADLHDLYREVVRPIVLLCFEDIRTPGSGCHRWDFTTWMKEHGFPDIPELAE